MCFGGTNKRSDTLARPPFRFKPTLLRRSSSGTRQRGSGESRRAPALPPTLSPARLPSRRKTLRRSPPPSSRRRRQIVVHVNYHPEKWERMKAVIAKWVGGDDKALDSFPDGSQRRLRRGLSGWAEAALPAWGRGG